MARALRDAGLPADYTFTPADAGVHTFAVTLRSAGSNWIGVNEVGGTVNGGASVNDALLQYQADIMQLPVVRPKVTETTALGAGLQAGLAVGFWTGLDDIAKRWRAARTFEALIKPSDRKLKMARWQRVMEAVALLRENPKPAGRARRRGHQRAGADCAGIAAEGRGFPAGWHGFDSLDYLIQRSCAITPVMTLPVLAIIGRPNVGKSTLHKRFASGDDLDDGGMSRL